MKSGVGYSKVWKIIGLIALVSILIVTILFYTETPTHAGSGSGGGGPVDPSSRPSAHPKLAYTVVRTFFATDRSLTGKRNPRKMFGDERSTLRYGSCDVSIPPNHRMGILESASIWKLEFNANPDKHVVLRRASVSSKDKFFSDLSTRVRKSKNDSAFLFIHGYNVSFEDAARRTAQMSYDLAFDGAPVFYSWPSKNLTTSYIMDEQSIEWSQTNIKIFLEEFLTQSTAKNIYLIAHSMGSRGLTRAISSLLQERPELRERLKEIILAAPDIDAEVFKRDIAPKLSEKGQHVTLYASSQDVALAASKEIHGYPRAGDSTQGVVVVKGVETIDASNVDTSFLGHSYFVETTSILSDMFSLMKHNKRAGERFGLRGIDTKEGRYWEFKL